jgi:hypothetical protein
METSARVLAVGGLSVLSYGLLLGFGMVRERSKAAHAPRYLLAAHLAALIQGTLLMALTTVVGLSSLSAGLETVAASVLLAGVALFDLGLTMNWRSAVNDGFAEKALGTRVTAMGTPLVLSGTAIVFTGVVKGL